MQYAIKVSETQQNPSRSPTLYNTGNHCNYTTEKCKILLYLFDNDPNRVSL